jgi:hypothetical protein
MTKKQLQEIEHAKAIWADTVTEDEVVEKFGISKPTLRRMRSTGRITKFRYLTPSTTGNPERPGKKPVYSLIELTKLFCPTI